MPRKISRKGLVRKLDKVFSIYIRTRHAKEELVRCVTCKSPLPKHWKEVDAGRTLYLADTTLLVGIRKTYTFNVKAVMAFTEVKTT